MAATRDPPRGHPPEAARPRQHSTQRNSIFVPTHVAFFLHFESERCQFYINVLIAKKNTRRSFDIKSVEINRGSMFFHSEDFGDIAIAPYMCVTPR